MLLVAAGLALTGFLFAGLVLVLCLRIIQADRAAHARQLEGLLQRIQAPEVAVMDHSVQQETVPPPAPVSMDDDAAQWLARGVDVSKDELAEAYYQQELA